MNPLRPAHVRFPRGAPRRHSFGSHWKSWIILCLVLGSSATVWLVTQACVEAERGEDAHALAAHSLAETLIDLGELRAAAEVIHQMSMTAYRALRDHAEGRLQAARGRPLTAMALFVRASKPGPETADAWRLAAMLDLVHALLAQGRTADARQVLGEAAEVARTDGKLTGDAFAQALRRLGEADPPRPAP